MPTKNPKRLVIDADIAQAAGHEDAVHPTAVRCRDFLKEVRRLGHHIVMAPDVEAEWEIHQSSFSRVWLTQMASRNLIYTCGATENQSLRAVLREIVFGPGVRDILMKDAHLIEAAMATDRLIASLERRARQHFTDVARSVIEIRTIVWVNPDNDDEQVTIWLRRGARAERKRMLGHSL